jgi:hypothetical protein
MSARDYYNQNDNQGNSQPQPQYNAPPVNAQVPEGRQGETGDRGLGTWIGAAAGGMLGHHEGKESGHGTMGTIGGSALGAIAGKLVGDLFEGKDHKQQQHHNYQGYPPQGHQGHHHPGHNGKW